MAGDGEGADGKQQQRCEAVAAVAAMRGAIPGKAVGTVGGVHRENLLLRGPESK